MTNSIKNSLETEYKKMKSILENPSEKNKCINFEKFDGRVELDELYELIRLVVPVHNCSTALKDILIINLMLIIYYFLNQMLFLTVPHYEPLRHATLMPVLSQVGFYLFSLLLSRFFFSVILCNV